MEEYFYKKIKGYVVTGEVNEVDSPYQYTGEIQQVMQVTHQRILKNKIKNPQIIHKLIKKYPNVPVFRQYLSMLYQLGGKHEKALAINEKLLENYPDYLYARLNKASTLLEQDEFDLAREMLGKDLDLGALYPERKVFHVNEFVSFNQIVGQYYFKKGDLKAARQTADLLSDVVSMFDEQLLNFLSDLENEEIKQKLRPYLDALKDRPSEYDVFEVELPEQTEQAPDFHHEEITALYRHDLDIDPVIFQTILKLPRTTLIEDLEKVIEDSTRRYNYLAAFENEKANMFLLHAFALLSQLQSKDSLPLLLKTTSYHEEFKDFYFYDHLTETLWRFVYRMYKDDFKSLRPWLTAPDLSEDAKSILIQALEQIAIHQPKKQTEVIELLEDVLDEMLNHVQNPAICNIRIISESIYSLVILKVKKALPKIKLFFQLGLVETFYIGDLNEVIDLMNSTKSLKDRFKIYEHIQDYYKHVIDTWFGYNEEEPLDDKAIDEYLQELKQDQSASTDNEKELDRIKPLPSILPNSGKNVGRNEPCPCGSGRKYKHCCLKNN